MSGVEFNGNVGGIKGTQSLTNLGKISKAMNLGIMGYGHSGNYSGTTIERNIPGLANVVNHFAAIPEGKVYLNNGSNLDLTRATLIPDYGAETAEV